MAHAPDRKARRQYPTVVVGLLIGAILPVGPGALLSAHATPVTTIELTRHGWGHGRGMGQYGALGYAIDLGWNYHQILDHYYGGTTAGHLSPATLMTVDMTGRDGQDTIAVAERGTLT